MPASLRTGPIALPGLNVQLAALCYRIVKDKPQILLVTSRGTKRWILPKGWPMEDRTPAEAALQEAYEEAGVVGRVSPHPVGYYSYTKKLSDGQSLPCMAMVYPVRVHALLQDYREAGQRKRDWVSRKKAASRVEEPDLARLLKRFDPSGLHF
ncbi:NUDIX hydrolase [Pseudooceanicola sp. CBS1P-1]|uniref:NUDIX domain-containing protein n=2 Tax=Paracoccaceae TaxID=31989 RepID=A0A6L7FZJ4_9RHOB|nr:NUDIX hydrolase [Pseudooceanicola endophyticus]MXN17205.1 NUDIX domain-containing protein [Pseudooceanicola albus]